MIDLLNKYSSKERTDILASIALATSPSPSEKKLSSEQVEILNAIIGVVGAAGNPTSAESRNLINAYINAELTTSALANTDVGTILARAGERGRLLPSMYSLSIGERFMRVFHQFHVREHDVELTARYPDDVQHLRSGDDDAISLFIKLIEGKTKRDPFWTIGQFHRVGTVLHAHNFWRVYPSEIDITGVSEPIHLLRAFVAAMGTDISIDERRSQFIFNEPIPDQSVDQLQFKIADKAEAIATLSNGRNPDTGLKEIILAYGVSGWKYREYLKRHSVPVSPVSTIPNQMYGTFAPRKG